MHLPCGEVRDRRTLQTKVCWTLHLARLVLIQVRKRLRIGSVGVIIQETLGESVRRKPNRKFDSVVYASEMDCKEFVDKAGTHCIFVR